MTGFGLNARQLAELEADLVADADAVDATRWEARWALAEHDETTVTTSSETGMSEVLTYGYLDDDGEVRLSTVVVEYRPARKSWWRRLWWTP